jgi:excisionase family DNA binding protein
VEQRKIFDVKEIAIYLNCSISSVRKLVRNKEIPYFRIGSKLNFSKESIDIWIQTQEKQNSIPIQDNNIKSIKS